MLHIQYMDDMKINGALLTGMKNHATIFYDRSFLNFGELKENIHNTDEVTTWEYNNNDI